MNKLTYQFPAFLEPNTVEFYGTLFLSGTTITPIKCKGIQAINKVDTGIYHVTMSSGFPTNHPHHIDVNVIGTGSLVDSHRLLVKKVDVTSTTPHLILHYVSGSGPTKIDPGTQFVTASIHCMFKNSSGA